ncbi:MAG TPA: xanthine dehydrogenase family protein subunit M [Ktedonobacter sp.]|jgi:carbon-monoxide dehydrogenase medium subunit|nr:xanthine dehydrogenase family protein subunit M [Ktedonobacter sp.]HAG98055.1 xanthine dehydrogenase family protein subunit M [Ktedonobacter sp.]HAT46576.1 xanthine dehydrogenase family protein subunit M [Ktedonobacter sp.]HBE28653.1 xanthine dehydrogenase family protein subunit M [Ktedonobacter sp.]HCF83698.1 xanthine dehydrogenase family protein subunit M [Ktedonobacter sp.]
MLKIAAYHSPTTLIEAAALLAEDGRTAIAGGTDLLVNPRYMVGVREVVDIRRLGLNYIRVENGWLYIGAGATMRTVAQRVELQGLANGILARGAAVCGSPNIRNMATLAGNIASALPSADTPPALLALDAEVVLVGMRGERVVPLDSFFVGPAKSVRERDLIRELRIPLAGSNALRGGFYKIGRTAEDISMVNAAATLKIQDGKISMARLVLGAVAPVPLRVSRAEEALVGQAATEETFQRVAEIVRDEVRPITDHRATAEYRRRISAVATVRALRQAAGLATPGEEWQHA